MFGLLEVKGFHFESDSLQKPVQKRLREKKGAKE